MRKILMMAGAAALALTMPALAKPGGEKGGGKGGGGHKAAQHHGGGHGGGKGRGGGDWKGPKAHKEHKQDRGWARQEFRQEHKAEKRFAKADKDWRKAEKDWRKQEAKADKQWAKQERKERRFRDDDRRYADRDYERGRDYDERRYRDDVRYGSAYAGSCPPGLAKKGNGCLPPGQAKKAFGLGERLPLAAFAGYNLPSEYQDWYGDNPEYSYRADDGYIYRVDNQTNLVSALIPLLGGGFGVGNLLPAGYDTYNLPMQYRDDYYDTSQASYRYGDDAIYQVDPQSQLIQSVVALLAGDLNVGQLLPSGYDTYNLPMDYRDQYQDSDEAMYRYADGNIYEVDPQSRMIEAIVAQLV